MRPAPTRRRQASLAALVIAALAIAACDSEPESETRPSIPADWSAGTNGWSPATSGQPSGSISAVALSFMVHEPSAIIERSSARSFPCSRRRYRSISVSVW